MVFSDVTGNRLCKVDSRNRVTPLLADVQRSPEAKPLNDSLYTRRPLIGSNGTVPTSGVDLIVAQFSGATLDKVNLVSKVISTLVLGHGSPRFVLPNDLSFGPNGELYFTAHEGIFRVRDGKAVLFRQQPANGLAFAPDGSFLYASEGVSKIIKIALNPDGSAGAAETFLDTKGDPAKGEYLDGMKVDARGNLWAVGPGGVWIVNPAGKLLGRILAPTVSMPTGEHHRFTNLAFGGRSGSTLYLTAPGGVYSIKLRTSLAQRPRY